METLQLNGFYCGIVTTEFGSKEYLEEKRRQWTKEGRFCWFNRVSSTRNQQFPDDV